ncbi:MAG: glutamine-hydrolyzing carbamoyl-phosphate synthase small subunit [Magnetococcales bacterium]|nr:glutamine-hydrolyzing carbamoyl-phosphate synthase small subunit [Magnetococcales bacterium]
MTSDNNRAVLVLEDGTRFDGFSFGASGEQVGEVCFNSAMTGYQEIITDPSYAGQIVTMTAPQIGNVGVNPEDMESEHPRIRGFVVRENARMVSNWRARETLGAFLIRHAVPAIEGIDTRQLVNHLREHGAMRGTISTVDFDTASLVAKARTWPGLTGMDLTAEVSCPAPHSWTQGGTVWKERIWSAHSPGEERFEQAGKRVAVLDFGVKHNILRSLVDVGCHLTVLPSRTTAAEILALQPDGVFLSNGPGDPEAVRHAIEAIGHLLRAGLPLFGICLGHQMLCLALGAKTRKLKFGHRGGNHPVKNLLTGQVEVTSQNHGFVVEGEGIPDRLEVTHISLFDGTVEGVRMRDAPVFSVQYHPEASPGPHDAHYLFRHFAKLMTVA